MRGRAAERRAIDAVLDATRSGHGGALILRGEPGAGTTTLLDYAAQRADDLRVVHALPVASEMEFAFAGLHQLCAPLLVDLERLPAPQRRALEVAFGLHADGIADRFLVALAVLQLLSDLAREQPVVCIVDDTCWLDAESTGALAFVGRRLASEPIALLVATRESATISGFAGLPEIVVGGLAHQDARDLLRSVVHGPLEPRIRDRIVAETAGNPAALLELSRRLTDAELAGGFGAPDTLLSVRVEQDLLDRVRGLAPDARRLLLVSAADPLGDTALVLQAAQRLGVATDDRAAVGADGLLALGSRARFADPLIRPAAYQAASAQERRAAHAALADATDDTTAPDHKAWHRAQATLDADADVAEQLERLTERAAARGGWAAAAAFLERAAGLSPDRALRARRLLAAADARHRAGAPHAALELLAAADDGRLDALGHVRLERLQARVAFTVRRGGDATAALLRSAQRLAPLDPPLARETYLDALAAALDGGRLSPGPDARTVAAAVRTRTRPGGAPTALDVLLDGLATRLTEGFAAAAPVIREALARVHEEPAQSGHGLAARAAAELWELDTARRLLADQVRVAHASGALTGLPIIINILAALHVQGGELAEAQRLVGEAEAIVADTGNARVDVGRLHLAPWRGGRETAALVKAVLADAKARGDGRQLTAAEYAIAVLSNGLGRHRAALSAARRALRHEELLGYLLLPELVEAAAGSGEPALAAAALGRLTERMRVSRTDWAVGIEARCRALLTEGQAAQALHEQAIERLSAAGVAAQAARARLLYGEWLRREGRHPDAREQLRAAAEMFASMGADAFAHRANHELLTTGDRPRGRAAAGPGKLTSRELQIARLAGDGHTNPEIGGRLYISPRTVEYHLHKVFKKLNVVSRSQLPRALSDVAARDGRQDDGARTGRRVSATPRRAAPVR